MILVVCVDDQYGMLFNRRRQSSDSAVAKKIVELSAGKKLLINPYSSGLFPENTSIYVDEDFLLKASEGDYCFVENLDVSPYISCSEKIVIFHWNRRYPADLHFPKDMLDGEWKVECSLEFSGSSHEKITMEVYRR